MSATNSIALGARERGETAEPLGLGIPPEVESRYEVRLVDTPGSEQRIGLFPPGNRQTPAIEITADRIVARREDAQTIDSLVRIARHNGWDSIDVDGSPEFRKAIWTAATREGLAVSGYEPSFVEQEELAAARRGDRAVKEQRLAEQPLAVQPTEPAALTQARSGESGSTGRPRSPSDTQLSEDDSRLLLRVSALTEDRKALYARLREDLGVLEREVQFERIDTNRDALDGALDRALDSPTVAQAFQRAGYEPEALRASGRGGEWDTQGADAIYLARSNLHRDNLPRDAGTPTILDDQVEAEWANKAIPAFTALEAERAEAEPILTREGQERSAISSRHHEDNALAELFLNGASDRVAADPRLVGAIQVQTVMEQHIGEVFGGDAARMASANLESRQLISDALRRGLDVSVREPTPVRQVEPIEVRADLER